VRLDVTPTDSQLPGDLLAAAAFEQFVEHLGKIRARPAVDAASACLDFYIDDLGNLVEQGVQRHRTQFRMICG
jgi:hypothetical protein